MHYWRALTNDIGRWRACKTNFKSLENYVRGGAIEANRLVGANLAGSHESHDCYHIHTYTCVYYYC